jgi:hypothetical protein
MENFLNQIKDNNRVVIFENSIFLYPWSFDQSKTLPLVIKDLVDSDVKNFNIYILAAEEFEIGAEFEKIINISLAEKFLNKNLKLYFIFGSQNLEFYQQCHFLYHHPSCNMYVNLWPTYWFTNTLNSIDSSYLGQKKFLEKKNFLYPYTSLNNVGKYHRCLLIDMLAKNKLLDSGAVTWHNFCVDENYSWNWTTSAKAKRSLSDSIEYLKDNYNQQFIPPIEFFQSFMSIVSETTDKTIFITEKTAMVLLLKQPFLVQGAPGFHNYLRDLGFELYTEIFNYDFDLESNIHKRTEMLIENVRSISTYNLSNLYNSIKPKLQHNRKLFFKIATDRSKYPLIVSENEFLKNHYSFINIYDI